jgi:integrase
MDDPKTSTTGDGDNIAAEMKALRARLAELQVQAKAARAAARARPGTKRVKLTKTVVANLPLPTAGNTIVWDTLLTGFGVRISPAGCRTYFLQARTRTGRNITLKLGRADRISGEQAREAAKKHLAALELGRDPAAELRAKRQAERERCEAPTMDWLWDVFEQDHLKGRRAKTQRAYAGWYRRHIKPALGRVKVADVTDQHLERLHRSVTETTGGSTANRVHAVASSMLGFAVKRKLVGVNVAKAGAVERNPEPPRERDLSDDELCALIHHLVASDAVEARLIEFCLATGCRRGEAQALPWSDVTDKFWKARAEDNKSKKTQRRPLNAAAQEVLAKLERRGARVFQGATESRVTRWWARARKALGLPDVRIHDLRHCAASIALNAGVPLAAVGRMLGHGVNSQAMTARYAHLADQPLAAASAAVAERLKLLAQAPPAGSA